MAIPEEIQEQALVDYNDERLTNINEKRADALAKNEQTYNNMIADVDGYYTDLKNQHQNWADEQARIQKEQTDFTIKKIEQQREQAEKDYIKEQSASYVDWQKQSDPYGVEAEKMASAGLTNSGYSESSQVSMYNTYQNRVATAREVLNQAKLNYDNNIKEAMLQNSAALAEIYANLYLEQAKLALEGFQYKNQLLLDQADKQLQIDNMYHGQYMDVLGQINTENALAEEIRQYNETMKWETEQAEKNREHDIKLKEIQHGYDKKLAEINQNYKLAYLNAETEKEKEIIEINRLNDLAKLEQELANEKALLKYEYDLKSAPITGNTGKATWADYVKAAGGGSTKVTTNAKTTTSNTTVNANSKLSLGKGPISDAEAARQVNAGKAKATIKNGQVYVEPVLSLPTSKMRKELGFGVINK